MLELKYFKSLILLSIASLMLGCSASTHKTSADDESYGAIADKSNMVPGMTSQVVVDEVGEINLEGFEVNNTSFEFLDNEANSEIGASILSLDAALGLAFAHSKDYQNQKELLYLEALALTFDRYRYTPTFSARALVVQGTNAHMPTLNESTGQIQ